jgi:NAD(P)-dependent dehydrogenase (short-subunit alcohol dehydrogenase family)
VPRCRDRDADLRFRRTREDPDDRPARSWLHAPHSGIGGAIVSREAELSGQTVLVIGGTSGIGLETARLAREHGAELIIAARNADRLQAVGLELAASIATVDATDFAALRRFFDELSGSIDHVMVTGPGPYYGPLAQFDIDDARRSIDIHLLLFVEVARSAVNRVRASGTLLFMGGTAGRRPSPGNALTAALTAAQPALTKNLALEVAPIRVNLIAAGFVDTPLSAAILGDRLETRREELRATLPIRRVIAPADVAALAVHLMANTAVTGATFDIDGGQQLLGA